MLTSNIVFGANTKDLSIISEYSENDGIERNLQRTKQDIFLERSDVLFDQWYVEMEEWVQDEQKFKGYDNEVPIDASAFWKMKYLDWMDEDIEYLSEQIGHETYNLDSRSTRAWSHTNSGVHCEIYVETGSATMENLKNEFDNVIWPSVTDAFGTPNRDSIDIYVFYTDGNNPESDGQGGLGGFFYGGYPNRIYVDNADISSWGYEITAHEFQHLTHNKKDANEELWIDEGCADYAIITTYGSNAGGVSSHLNSFKYNTDNDLTQFDNYMYDYGSCAAYITYLADQYGGTAFTRALISNSNNGFYGVSSALASLGESDDSIDAYLNWLAANYLDDNDIYDGEYGYTSLNIRVSLEESYSSYPMSDSSDVKRWGADYFRFTSGSDGLGLEFQGNGGGDDFAVILIKTGISESTVEMMDLDYQDKGFFSLAGFGLSFNSLIMVVTADSNAGYDFEIIPMDTTPPVTTISLDPVLPDGENGYYITNPTFELNSNENGSTYFYWEGDQEEIEYTGPVEIPEGINTIHYYSTDLYLNDENVKSITIKVDQTKPNSQIDIYPENPDGPFFNGWYVTEPDIDLFSAEEEVEIFYQWDLEDMEIYDGQVNILEGEHDFSWWSIDPAGNQEDKHNMSFKIDTLEPFTQLTILGNQSQVEEWEWYTETLNIELHSDDEVTTYYAWDTQDFNLYTESLTGPQGIHTLYYYSIDIAGNEEYIRQRTFKCDNIPPSTLAEVYPEEPNGNNGIYITRPVINLTTEEESAVTYYYWNEEMPRSGGSGIFVEEGSHSLYYFSMDKANNSEEVKHLNITVDLTPPLTSITKEPRQPDGENGWYNTIKLTLGSNSNDMETIYYWFDHDQTKIPYKQPITSDNTDIPDGGITLYYYSVDLAGNREETREFQFKIDSGDPEAKITISKRKISEGEETHIMAHQSDDEGSNLNYLFSFGDGKKTSWLTEKNISYAYDKPGTYTVELVVKDQSGLESEPVELKVIVEEDPVNTTFALGGADMIGIIIAAVFLLLLLILFIILVRRRRKRRGVKEQQEIEINSKFAIKGKEEVKEEKKREGEYNELYRDTRSGGPKRSPTTRDQQEYWKVSAYDNEDQYDQDYFEDQNDDEDITYFGPSNNSSPFEDKDWKKDRMQDFGRFEDDPFDVGISWEELGLDENDGEMDWADNSYEAEKDDEKLDDWDI